MLMKTLHQTVTLTVSRDVIGVVQRMLFDRLRHRLYRGKGAGAVAKILNAGQARLAAWGVGPRWLVTVEVTGRRTGRTIAFPAVVADYDGERYLVSMLGEHTNWVRNVRASGGRAALVHGRRELVLLEDVAVDQRAPIIRCYLRRAVGARAPHSD
jgi:hypothetical protein